MLHDTTGLRAGVSRARYLSAAVLVSALCACEKVTETVVEKGVQAAKEAGKGIEQGFEKGRKAGTSLDDALLVSSPKDLEGNGRLEVRGARAAPQNAEHAEVELVFENTLDRPLRITALEVIALDDEGFVVRPVARAPELTVEPRAKERLLIEMPAAATKLAKLRVWGVDHPLSR